jgi:TetR/AcrR family transcriptional regulator, transcriptional repressor of aconitase
MATGTSSPAAIRAGVPGGAEAQLSSGAVYRYFPSKDDIIAAIASDALNEITGALEASFDADVPPPLDEALGGMFAAIARLDDEQDATKVIVQVWAEALRSPALRARVTEEASRLLGLLTRLVERYQEHGLMARDVPAEHVARVLAGLLPGFMLQLAVLGDVDPAMFRHGLRAIAAGRAS